MPAPTRRDLLKLGAAGTGALAAARLLPEAGGWSSGAALPNILVLVFDAMSARHLSLYGYPRRTTPNFERFAGRATVYHQHYAAGNFTTPGTASMLTGLYPWTHRAINQSGLIARDQVQHSLFRALGERYHRLAFSQNAWPNYFFGQFAGDLERMLSPGSFGLLDPSVGRAFPRDLTNSQRAFDDFLLQNGHPSGSLVFGLAQDMALYERVVRARRAGSAHDIAHATNIPVYFRLQDVFEGILDTVAGLKAPFAAYLHTWSPHDPYQPAAAFAGLFDDGWHPAAKPVHALSRGTRRVEIEKQRLRYDRYIANVDFEFGRLLDGLAARGLLDQTCVLVTSDHGEMLERGDVGHMTPLLYEPVVHVPLLISAPGQTERQDVHLPTSNVDLLPTLVHLAGGEAPAWAEGQVLPGLGSAQDPERSVFVAEAKENQPWRAWSQGSFALRKGPYKLTYYMGYDQLDKQDKFELYDVEADPEELQDLYSESAPVARDLRQELLARVQAENAKFSRAG